MKKIILTFALILVSTFAFAQKSNATAGKKVQKISNEDPHNPLVNGIPYDQYKAQVQAEEKQRAAKEAEAKNQMKEELNREAKINLSPNPNISEKPKK